MDFSQLKKPLDPNPQNGSDSFTSDFTSDLAHINQEMYKKNFELAARNKTLSLLRQIDEIILSSVTDLKEIAQKVADLSVSEAVFNMVYIFIVNNNENILIRVALSVNEGIKNKDDLFKKLNYVDYISLINTDNIAVQAVKDKKVCIENLLFDILQHNNIVTMKESEEIQTAGGIKSSLVFPLIVRNEVIGVMMVSISEDIKDLSDSQKDLIERLAGVIGIALDNAMLYNEVQETNKKLRALDMLKDEFVSLASHELRTPMTAIKSYLWLFLENNKGRLDERQKLYLERAYSSTDRLINLVNDMLNVSRIESGRLIINLTSLDLLKLVKEAIAEILPTAQKERITLVMQQPNFPLPHVVADINKIKEVLINLIGNSIKFTPPDGKITISFTLQKNMVVTHITDTGRGIASEDLSKLFQKFGLIEKSYLVKQNTHGTGLGLYISKSIIRLHGGEITVESPGENKGSTFSFSLKAHNDPALPIQQPKPQSTLS